MKLTELNQLIYNNKPLKGHWRLAKSHEISYKAKPKKKYERVTVKGTILQVEPHNLILAVSQKQEDQKIITSTVRLKGTWHLDSKNRIVFEVKRGKSKTDKLTFKGQWTVNKSNQIIYTYTQEALKTKKKTQKRLAFRGHWDVSGKNRLTYYLGGSKDSTFRLRGTFQTKSVYAKKGEIRYQLGAQLEGKKTTQIITLFGKWKLSRKFALAFEIDYKDGTKRSILFETQYAFSKDHQIKLGLKTKEGKPLGLNLILTRDFFKKDGQAFLSFSKTLDESRIEGGMRLRW